ncbi:MAG: NTP transferase domain-containing protein, partial [Thermoplasmata archaeon]|nr:NTP transferase domain-containing protein [Thermoplasmata archaeon]
AAGEGTRMYPLTENRPKPMIKVAGRPLISWTLGALAEVGIRDVGVVIGWEGRRLKDLLGDGREYGLSLRYVVQEERLGTAHAIGTGEELMGGSPFLSINGDLIVTRGMLDTVISRWRESGRTVMSVAPVDNPREMGVVEVEDGMVRGIWEKVENPPSSLANAGIYCFTPDIFQRIRETPLSPRGEYEITDTLSEMIEEPGVAAAMLPGRWIDVGRPWDLLAANEFLLSGMEGRVEGTVEEGAVLKGMVIVEEGAVVRSGSYIQGPVLIDREATIGPNCYIRPSTYIGRGCHIGAAVEIKNSIIMDGSNVPHHNYVGDSIIGENCNLGSGTKVANLRFDDASVHTYVKGVRVNSGRRKLGVIMGDGVKTGVNVSIDPGTVIGGGVWISPGAYVRGHIHTGARVK